MRRRLPFKLPEFPPRVIWSSVHAREVWQPRIQRGAQAWITAERESVAAGIRPSALQHVTPEDLPVLMKELAPRGLIVLPLGQVPRVQGYQSAASQTQPGDPFDYKCAITRPEHAAEWADAWNRSDDDAIGRLLGTPECCRRFFDRVWRRERWFDTTVPMFGNNEHATGLNMLWRWLGVRPVSHLPCSPDCIRSRELADHVADLLPEPERTWHLEILSWPVLYSSLHGIAEITSPIHRMAVPTDAVAERIEIRYLGSSYPAEGAKGLRFPFRQLAPAAPLRFVRTVQQPSDNGFSSREAQDAAHAKLLAVIAGQTFGTVLDLGCGDGTLLSKIPAKRRIGIESDPAKTKKAKARIDRVILGDCTDRVLLASVLTEEQPDLVIAQRDRNPTAMLPGYRVLSYSYEQGHDGADLIDQAA